MGAAEEYDVIVVGAGSTGENVADRTVQGGLRSVVVESELVGGECSYWACMPSKALLRSGQARGAARSVGGASQAVTGELDVAAVLARRDRFTSHYQDDGQVSWLSGAHIDLVRGAGRLTGEREVTVVRVDSSTDPDAPAGSAANTRVLRARQAVVLAVGSEALLPPIDGLATAAPWTAREATSATRVPNRLLILGGGVVGVEMATAFSELGAQVVVVEAAPRLLAAYEDFVGEAVEASLRARGVVINTGASVVHVARAEVNGPVTVTTDDGDSFGGDELLVCVGRAPRTAHLGLEVVGLEPGSWLDVDETLLVRAVEGGWLYAAGDVNHRALLTHMGKYQARACGEAIVARANGQPVDDVAWSRYAATADHDAVPQVVFSEPEVASVGLSERQARARGIEIKVAEYEIGNVAGAAVYADNYKGHAKIVVDVAREVIVGVTMVGPVVGEMLHAATVMVVGEVPLARLWHAVPSYPTISEVWLRLLETYGR